MDPRLCTSWIWRSPGGASVLDLTGGPGVQIPSKAGLRWKIARTNGGIVRDDGHIIYIRRRRLGCLCRIARAQPVVQYFRHGVCSVRTDSYAGWQSGSDPFGESAADQRADSLGNRRCKRAPRWRSRPAGTTATSNVAIVATAPGIFLAGSLGAILNPDATLNSPSNPAQRGQYVSVYCHGTRSHDAQRRTSSGGDGCICRCERADSEAFICRRGGGIYRTVSG